MADFADEFTSRFKIAYQANGKRHEMKFRYGRVATVPPQNVTDNVQDFLSALAPRMVSDWAILDTSYSIFDTTFYIPFQSDLSVTPTSGQGAEVGLSPNNWNFQGLTALGHRASVYVYGMVFETLDNQPGGANNFRLLAGENANVLAALTALDVLRAFITGADNEQVIAWKRYANLNVNSYYQRKARQ